MIGGGGCGVCVWMGWGLGLWGDQMISMDKPNSFFFEHARRAVFSLY